MFSVPSAAVPYSVMPCMQCGRCIAEPRWLPLRVDTPIGKIDKTDWDRLTYFPNQSVPGANRWCFFFCPGCTRMFLALPKEHQLEISTPSLFWQLWLEWLAQTQHR